MRKSGFFFLQHKLPWESVWKDFEKNKNSKKLLDLLVDEPLHVIEMEYRIIKKEKIKLKTSSKSIMNPIYVYSGNELADVVKQYLERS